MVPLTGAPGKSQTVIIRFAPTSPGVFSQALSITHNATNLSNPASVPLNGKGISGVNLLINTTPLDFGNVIVGQSVNQVLTIANLSTSANTLTGSVGNLSGPFSVVSGGGSLSLAPGESQSVVIGFSPTVPGTFSQTLSITHNATNQINPLSIPISGTGTMASINIDISPSSLNFGNIFIGKSATQTFTITNLSNSTDVLEGNINDLSGPFSVVKGGGTFNLAPGKSRSMTISFSPGSEGTFSETLFITHNATNQGSPTKVSLSGTGQALIQLSIVPSSIDFGNILAGQSSTQTLTIKNEATSTGTLEGTVGTLSGPFSIMKGGGTFSLAPGKSQSVVINFSPTSSGTFSQLLTITHNATGQASPTDISITGTGVLPVVNMLISQTSLNFGNVSVGKTATRSFTITNQATSTDTLTGSVGNLSGPFSVVSGDGAFSLAPGESQFVVIAFSPELSGSASETLVITHNATNQTNPTNLTLTGTGTAVINLSINPTSISFGNIAVGQTDSQVFVVTNETNSTDTLEVNVGNLSAPFSIVSGGGAFTLAPGKSRPILISFSPTSPGTFSQTLSITHNATNSSSPVNVTIAGTGVFVVNLSVELTPTTGSVLQTLNFGEVNIGQSATQMITITNQASSTNALTGTVGTLSNPFSVISGSGSFSLAPGKSQTLLVHFSPTSAGTFSQTLVITHNATNFGSPLQIPISGAGKAMINIFISSTS
ncbi:MAG: choice-of-anchor D domain-containing protein, partial [candidate division WOR-3 bacterium]